MPQVKLTVRNASTLPAPTEGFIEYFDLGLPGFGIRVSSKGRRTWIVRYRIRGRKAKGSMSLGTVSGDGKKDFADARGKAKDALRAAEKGIDPAEPARKERHAETFMELAERYIEEYAKGPHYREDGKGKPRKRSWKTDQRIINSDLNPIIGNMKALTITRADIRQVLRTVLDRDAPTMANRVHEVVRMIFAWALAEEIGGIEHNPCDGLPRPSEEHSRDRVLNTEEIKILWRALRDPPAGMPLRCALALSLQLVTAQRKGEVIAAEWLEMDRNDERMWTIPAEKSKNARSHRVPLSDMALELLAEVKKLSGRSRWLFPSPDGDKPMTARAVNHAVLRVKDKLGIGDDIRPHDLRRSAASHMTSIGISRFIVARVLNHAEHGVTAVYDRHSYDREKRQALDAWARRLDEITSAKQQHPNVEELRRA
jgi:integrase